MQLSRGTVGIVGHHCRTKCALSGYQGGKGKGLGFCAGVRGPVSVSSAAVGGCSFVSEDADDDEDDGEARVRGGKMNVNLVNVLWMGESVTTNGVVKEITPEGGSGRQRAQLEVWCQKADGTVITVGSASAVVE